MIEGSGSGSRAGSGSGSRHLTNGSGSGRPKNTWIRWIRIRIRNTDPDINKKHFLKIKYKSNENLNSGSMHVFIHSASMQLNIYNTITDFPDFSGNTRILITAMSPRFIHTLLCLHKSYIFCIFRKI